MKKRILTLVLALVMVCSLLPVTAMAVDHNALTIAGTNVVDGDTVTYWLCNGDGSITDTGASESDYDVKYDPTTTTLTLKNANIVSTTGNAIDVGLLVGSLTIKLEGINTVTTTGDTVNGIHQANGPLTILRRTRLP